MKVVIPGGSGQVGTVLARAFLKDGHEVVVLSRRLQKQPWRVVTWEPPKQGDWSHELEGADVVINLAGRSVNCRYNTANREEIVRSRVDSVKVLGDVISRLERPPKVWLQASTATIYAHRHDAPNDEETGIVGGLEPDVPDTWRFSIEVATAWEKALDEAKAPGTRKVKMRSAMIMSPDRDGIFDTLLQLTQRGLGGTAADGRQFISWIHETDFIRSIYWLIEHSEVDGAVNLASPNPLPNREFMRVLRKAAGIKVGLPATKWMLEIGAIFMRTETELILKSRRVIPGRMLKAGFLFQYPDWPEAAEELLQRNVR